MQDKDYIYILREEYNQLYDYIFKYKYLVKLLKTLENEDVKKIIDIIEKESD